MIECADPLPQGRVLPVMGLTLGLVSVGRAWQGETCIRLSVSLLPTPAAALIPTAATTLA